MYMENKQQLSRDNSIDWVKCVLRVLIFNHIWNISNCPFIEKRSKPLVCWWSCWCFVIGFERFCPHKTKWREEVISKRRRQWIIRRVFFDQWPLWIPMFTMQARLLFTSFPRQTIAIVFCINSFPKWLKLFFMIRSYHLGFVNLNTKNISNIDSSMVSTRSEENNYTKLWVSWPLNSSRDWCLLV